MFAKKFSIQSILILGYSVAITVSIIFIVFLLYTMSVDIVNQGSDDFLEKEASDIHFLISDNKKLNLSLLKKYIINNPLNSRKSFYSYYVRLSKDNRLIMQTPDMPVILKYYFSQFVKINEPKFSWVKENKKYLIFSTKNRQFRLEVALDISHQSDITHQRLFFIIVLFSGLLLTFFANYYVTRRGLKGLNILIKIVKKINSVSLSHRINPDNLAPEIKPLSIAFNKMLERIENAFSELKQMADDLSHELSTPLTNVLMQTELLLSLSKENLEYRELLGSNLEELQKIQSFIQNILFLSRMDHLNQKIEKISLSVSTEIKKIIDYYGVLLEEKNIKIYINGDDRIVAHLVMFSRLMSNIISNAIKYSNLNGKIYITISADDKYVLIKVKDNGIGIAEHHLPYIFNRFYRVGSFSPKGTGLGLAIAQSIVQRHEGKITLNSQLGTGTVVDIFFPKSEIK